MLVELHNLSCLDFVKRLKISMQSLKRCQLSLDICALMRLVSKLCLQLLQGLLGIAKLVCDAGQVGCLLIMSART